MEALNPFERASLYVALHTYLRWLAEDGGEPPIEVINFFASLGLQLPKEVSDNAVEYVRRFRAGSCRMELNPAARANLQNHLTAFYNSAGYVSTEPADTILAITAFTAHLAMDTHTAHVVGDGGADKLEQQLHRFISAHLLPTLKHLRPPEKRLADAIEELERLVGEDARALSARLSRPMNY